MISVILFFLTHLGAGNIDEVSVFPSHIILLELDYLIIIVIHFHKYKLTNENSYKIFFHL